MGEAIEKTYCDLPPRSPRANKVITGLLFVSLVAGAVQIVGEGFLSVDALNMLAAGTVEGLGIATIVYFVLAVLSVVGVVGIIRFNKRGEIVKARMRTRGLIVVLILSLVACLAINGVVPIEVTYLFQFFCVIAYQVYNDPNLDRSPKFLNPFKEGKAARESARKLNKDGGGYIPLNFFNLFWIFVVACVLGLCVEVVFCLLERGVIESRAGLLWGPFSPIYGFGAVLMTIALNRVWYKSALLTYVIAGLIGAAFEFFVSWFMQVSLGVTAWDYSGSFLNIQGRTDFAHFLAWGMLGLVFIRILLPELLSLVNIVPLRWRAVLTVVFTAFMLFNGVMTMMTLSCWSERQAGLPVETEVQQFCAEYFPDDFMQARFETMTMSKEGAQKAQQDLIRS